MAMVLELKQTHTMTPTVGVATAVIKKTPLVFGKHNHSYMSKYSIHARKLMQHTNA